MRVHVLLTDPEPWTVLGSSLANRSSHFLRSSKQRLRSLRLQVTLAVTSDPEELDFRTFLKTLSASRTKDRGPIRTLAMALLPDTGIPF